MKKRTLAQRTADTLKAQVTWEVLVGADRRDISYVIVSQAPTLPQLLDLYEVALAQCDGSPTQQHLVDEIAYELNVSQNLAGVN